MAICGICKKSAEDVKYSCTFINKYEPPSPGELTPILTVPTLPAGIGSAVFCEECAKNRNKPLS